MNIFVLNTGRCGSVTFIKACQHITNFTSAHESRINMIGEERLAYPDNHIEADNRLSWFLGRLDKQYGNKAFYVHLTRNKQDTAASFTKRTDFGIMKAYADGIVLGEEKHGATDLAHDYIETIEANIELFLKDKTNKLEVRIESVKEDFKAFWEAISAQGDINLALKEWDTNYNASS